MNDLGKDWSFFEMSWAEERGGEVCCTSQSLLKIPSTFSKAQLDGLADRT
jgi:hypothetical protein